ncbi:MAG: hypothetical protein WD845_13125 [Pirellulales bacterium]
MLTTDQIVADLAERIGLIYYHSARMYGGDALGVDLLLWAYHDLWCEIVERRQEFESAYRRVLAEHDCQANNLPGRYRVVHPKAEDEEVRIQVVEQWRKISALVGIPIPHEALRAEFEKWIP